MPETRESSAAHRCCQCGREGTRGFRKIGGFEHPEFGWVDEMYECVGKTACRRRWPRRATYAE